MSRTRAENRYNSTRKALRKQRISEEIYHYEFYDNLHEYSKSYYTVIEVTNMDYLSEQDLKFYEENNMIKGYLTDK